MSRYSAFGLDTEKKSTDRGSIGSLLCPWCQLQINQGLSMCFANWVICLGCIREGIKQFEDPEGSERILEDTCFKNCAKQATKLCFMSTGAGFQIGVCLDDLKTGLFYLENKLNVDKKGQLKLSF